MWSFSILDQGIGALDLYVVEKLVQVIVSVMPLVGNWTTINNQIFGISPVKLNYRSAQNFQFIF